MKKQYFILFFALLIISCNFRRSNFEFSKYPADYYYNQGVTCHNNEDYKGALDNYNKAILLDSTVSEYFLNRGVAIELVYNDTLSALNDYRKAIQLDAHNAVAYYNMGCVLSDQGNDKDASDFFRICIAINPQYYPAYYNCAYSQYKIKDYNEALKNFEKAIQYTESQKYYAYYYMGLIYKETGQPDKAKSCFEQAAALGNSKAKKELTENK